MDASTLALVVATALAGGVLPLLVRWSGRKLHLALAFSTGIFLGAVFLHLLPELPGAVADGHEGHAHAHSHGGGHLLVWGGVLVGVLSVYLLEALALRTHDHDDLHRHRAVGWAALWGLSVHALTAGMAWAVASEMSAQAAQAVLVAILAHKAFEAFSLSTVFLLAEVPRQRVALLALLFAFVTPLGALVGQFLISMMGTTGHDVLLALAAGTFLYVCLCELLGEVFHHREDVLAKLGLLTVGIGLMVAAQMVEAG